MTMKILKTVAVVSALTVAALSANANAGQTSFTKADNSAATKLCNTAVKGNRPMMYKEIKSQGYRKSYIQNNLMCNNMSVGAFVAQYGSEAMQRLLPQKTNVKVIDIATNSSMGGYVEITK